MTEAAAVAAFAAASRTLDLWSSGRNKGSPGNPKPSRLEHHRRTGMRSSNLAGAILTPAEVNLQLPRLITEQGGRWVGDAGDGRGECVCGGEGGVEWGL